MVHPFPLVLSLTAPETSEDVQGALKCLAGYVGSVPWLCVTCNLSLLYSWVKVEGTISPCFPPPFAAMYLHPGATFHKLPTGTCNLSQMCQFDTQVLIEKRLFPVKIVGHPDLVDFLSAQLCGSGCPRLKPGLRMQFFRLNPDTCNATSGFWLFELLCFADFAEGNQSLCATKASRPELLVTPNLGNHGWSLS